MNERAILLLFVKSSLSDFHSVRVY